MPSKSMAVFVFQIHMSDKACRRAITCWFGIGIRRGTRRFGKANGILFSLEIMGVQAAFSDNFLREHFDGGESVRWPMIGNKIQ